MPPLNGMDIPWRTEITIGIGATSTPVLIPAGLECITVVASPGGGGTVTVQHCATDPNVVEATPASGRWVDWDAGAVAARTSRVLLGPVTALRASAATAAGVVEILGRRKWS